MHTQSGLPGVDLEIHAFGWLQALGMVLVLGGVVAGQPGTIAWVRRTVAVRRTRRGATAGASC